MYTYNDDEWIAQELIRIKENQEPRHCPDYEALIELIEDLSRVDMIPPLNRAFQSLCHYCWDPSFAPHHPTPIRILFNLEHLFSPHLVYYTHEQQRSIQIQLSTLLTIQTPIVDTSTWLASWQVIHQWLQTLSRPHDLKDWQDLLSAGIHAFQSARSRYGPLPDPVY